MEHKKQKMRGSKNRSHSRRNANRNEGNTSRHGPIPMPAFSGQYSSPDYHIQRPNNPHQQPPHINPNMSHEAIVNMAYASYGQDATRSYAANNSPQQFSSSVRPGSASHPQFSYRTQSDSQRSRASSAMVSLTPNPSLNSGAATSNPVEVYAESRSQSWSYMPTPTARMQQPYSRTPHASGAIGNLQSVASSTTVAMINSAFRYQIPIPDLSSLNLNLRTNSSSPSLNDFFHGYQQGAYHPETFSLGLQQQRGMQSGGTRMMSTVRYSVGNGATDTLPTSQRNVKPSLSMSKSSQSPQEGKSRPNHNHGNIGNPKISAESQTQTQKEIQKRTLVYHPPPKNRPPIPDDASAEVIILSESDGEGESNPTSSSAEVKEFKTSVSDTSNAEEESEDEGSVSEDGSYEEYSESNSNDVSFEASSSADETATGKRKRLNTEGKGLDESSDDGLLGNLLMSAAVYKISEFYDASDSDVDRPTDLKRLRVCEEFTFKNSDYKTYCIANWNKAAISNTDIPQPSIHGTSEGKKLAQEGETEGPSPGETEGPSPVETREMVVKPERKDEMPVKTQNQMKEFTLAVNTEVEASPKLTDDVQTIENIKMETEEDLSAQPDKGCLLTEDSINVSEGLALQNPDPIVSKEMCIKSESDTENEVVSSLVKIERDSSEYETVQDSWMIAQTEPEDSNLQGEEEEMRSETPSRLVSPKGSNDDGESSGSELSVVSKSSSTLSYKLQRMLKKTGDVFRLDKDIVLPYLQNILFKKYIAASQLPKPATLLSKMMVIGPNKFTSTLINGITRKFGVGDNSDIIVKNGDEIEQTMKDIRSVEEMKYVVYMIDCDHDFSFKKFNRHVALLHPLMAPIKKVDFFLCWSQQTIKNRKSECPQIGELSELACSKNVFFTPYYYDVERSVTQHTMYCASRFRKLIESA